jgi:hypothetical protein
MTSIGRVQHAIEKPIASAMPAGFGLPRKNHIPAAGINPLATKSPMNSTKTPEREKVSGTFSGERKGVRYLFRRSPLPNGG